jgi:hypothetical protein
LFTAIKDEPVFESIRDRIESHYDEPSELEGMKKDKFEEDFKNKFDVSFEKTLEAVHKKESPEDFVVFDEETMDQVVSVLSTSGMIPSSDIQAVKDDFNGKTLKDIKETLKEQFP